MAEPVTSPHRRPLRSATDLIPAWTDSREHPKNVPARSDSAQADRIAFTIISTPKGNEGNVIRLFGSGREIVQRLQKPLDRFRNG